MRASELTEREKSRQRGHYWIRVQPSAGWTVGKWEINEMNGAAWWDEISSHMSKSVGLEPKTPISVSDKDLHEIDERRIERAP